MSFVIGTMDTQVRWYEFSALPTADCYVDLHEILDLKRVTQFHDKESAKFAAVKAGLKTWRYVRI